MKLLRVQVPNFRGLKNVDISFEPDFNPQVFPLGSLNGGGKSTLLQLIFTLLHDIGKKKSYREILSDINQNEDFIKNPLLASISIDESVIDFIKSKNNKKGLFFGQKSLDIKNKGGYVDANEIKEKIILISPSNQSHLFLPKGNRLDYHSFSKQIKMDLPNFFTYDSIELLTELFRLARDKDFQQRDDKNPFANTIKLENEINNLFLDGKKIKPVFKIQPRHVKDGIQGIKFELPNGKTIYPEDLSHGELKRLAIFSIVKRFNDSVILMDEVENGFHPDWQRHIVDDLVTWNPTNQYILATHSYELCRGITPAHIKELAPNLFNPAE
ncbi:MAG: hypothetical protein RIR79_1938 [Pseudomonadota bacterium]|jgi:energy-coupling factor transporter ATP-binding protein EcfA2